MSLVTSFGNCPCPSSFDSPSDLFVVPCSTMALVTHALVETLYRTDWGRIVATLIGVLGDFDLAEDVAQEAFAAAIAQWPETGVPEHPRAWIIQTARHKAVDRLRRRASYTAKLEALSAAPGYGVV